MMRRKLMYVCKLAENEGEVDDEDEEKGKAKGEGKDGSTMRTRCPTHHSPPRQGRGREGAVDPQLSHSSNTDISQMKYLSPLGGHL
ncbi:hypothetical protein J6590_067475 [Homalodisca vitripennis]|nr:hypothetical protein J6590_067475 [Homalodisca vitripennis]